MTQWNLAKCYWRFGTVDVKNSGSGQANWFERAWAGSSGSSVVRGEGVDS